MFGAPAPVKFRQLVVEDFRRGESKESVAAEMIRVRPRGKKREILGEDTAFLLFFAVEPFLSFLVATVTAAVVLFRPRRSVLTSIEL